MNICLLLGVVMFTLTYVGALASPSGCRCCLIPPMLWSSILCSRILGGEGWVGWLWLRRVFLFFVVIFTCHISHLGLCA